MSLGVPCATNRTKITSSQKLDFILQIVFQKKPLRIACLEVLRLCVIN